MISFFVCFVECELWNDDMTVPHLSCLTICGNMFRDQACDPNQIYTGPTYKSVCIVCLHIMWDFRFVGYFGEKSGSIPQISHLWMLVHTHLVLPCTHVRLKWIPWGRTVEAMSVIHSCRSTCYHGTPQTWSCWLLMSTTHSAVWHISHKTH